MRILFIPCSIDGLSKHSGSIRIRAEWPARYMEGAEIYNGTQSIGAPNSYQLYVFQKAYLGTASQVMIRRAAAQRERYGCVIAFDICDPDVLDQEHKSRMSKVIALFDFVVCTTNALADLMNQTFTVPVHVIPDRVDLAEIDDIARLPSPERAKKIVRDGNKPAVVWGGYESNSDMALKLLKAAEQMGLVPTVFAPKRPVPFAEFWRTMMEFDILLNPRPNVPPYKYKSENKTTIAQALMIPVARTSGDLTRLLDATERMREAVNRREEIEKQWDVRDSVQDWLDLFRAYRPSAAEATA